MFPNYENKKFFTSLRCGEKRNKMCLMEEKAKVLERKQFANKKGQAKCFTLLNVFQNSTKVRNNKLLLPKLDFQMKEGSNVSFDNRLTRNSELLNVPPKHDYDQTILSEIRNKRMQSLRSKMKDVNNHKFNLGAKVLYETHTERTKGKEALRSKNIVLQQRLKKKRKIAGNKEKKNENYKGRLELQKRRQEKLIQSSSLILTPNKHFIDNLHEFQRISRLGKGAYAKVYLIKHKKTNKVYALKTYPKSYFTKPHRITNIRNEVGLLLKCEHPNIIKLLNVCETKDNIHLIMEKGGHTSLDKYLRKLSGHRVSEIEAISIIQQVAVALKYLHDKGVSHRDIKLGNILIGEEGRVWIIDFGFATDSGDHKLQRYCGTPCYMCPEILKKIPYFGQLADSWALGVVFYRLVCGTVPFKGKGKELRRSIRAGNFEIPDNISDNVKSLLRNMLHMNTDKRASMDKILRCIFKEISWN